jgi:hypothetical protein
MDIRLCKRTLSRRRIGKLDIQGWTEPPELCRSDALCRLTTCVQARDT